MRTVENFTKASVGSEGPFQGSITLCPSCGRAGILQHLPEGEPEFVHVEIEEVLADGMLVSPVDRCALPS